MKKIIVLVLLLGFMASLAYGGTVATSDVESLVPARNFMVFGRPAASSTSLKDAEAYEVAADLTLEPRLLFPYSEHLKPSFYRVAYRVNGKDRHCFLLGSIHNLPLSILPPAVLHSILSASALVSEIGADMDEDNISSYALDKALMKNGNLFGPVDMEGWFKLLPADAPANFRELFRAAISASGTFGEATIKWAHLINPRVFSSLLLSRKAEDLGISLQGDSSMHMDRQAGEIFSQRNKIFVALDRDLLRLEVARKALKAGQAPDDWDTVEDSIETLIDILCGDISEQIEAGMEEIIGGRKLVARIRHEYMNGDYIEGKPDLELNFRNQAWHPRIISEMRRLPDPFLIMVGIGHMDRGNIPEIGKTGIINLLYGLYETETAFHGVSIDGVERMVSSHPHSNLTSERNRYHWVPEVVSTEGPYLEGLMAKLRAEAGSLGAGAAAAGAGVIGE